jgi:CRISPR/Cas system CSM-associated protein Csm3 (group 7 of RAMP superfamily)
MKPYTLEIKLLSDATLGRGDGVAGLVDAEVQHDAYGLPYLGGRALKGLLGAECADIVYALSRACPKQTERWQAVEHRLFGKQGSTLQGEAILQVGAAQLPADLRAAVAQDVRRETLTREQVLDTLTALRRQTAMDPETGAPKKETLRTMRVILRGTVLDARLDFSREPTVDDLALLAACVKAFRRAGIGRNRGRGKLEAELRDAKGQVVTDKHFSDFRKAVGV